jgi:tetratricopeptide (TPR) repeat protein
LGEYLERHPNDPDAIYLMARVANRLERGTEAASLLERCLALAPAFVSARFMRAKLLLQQKRYETALGETNRLLTEDNENPLFRQLMADILRGMGEDEQSLAILQKLAAENPRRSESWISYGDALRATGFQTKGIAAYRRAIECRPSLGSAWWSLANLKTVRFSNADIDAMQEQLKRSDLEPDDRINLFFSLGKAYEDNGVYDLSFEHYAKANAARRVRVNHDWDALPSFLAAHKPLFTAAFFQSRRGVGCKAPDPIFVVGLPRSGSTLIEQILSSHSAIEGTAELTCLTDVALRLEEKECRRQGANFPQILEKLEPAALAELGEEYLENARVHRKSGRPFFIDKAPVNYHHIGLIHLILPNAKIIDARRHPAACCLSMFKNNYTETNFRLSEFGRLYRFNVELMAHFDGVLPGRIHRVFYEHMVADPDAEIRRLLDYLGLPFEEQCLRFYETARTIRTPSSEQVRRAITGESVDHWRNFEPWLGPLIESLGSVITAYPSVPEELR